MAYTGCSVTCNAWGEVGGEAVRSLENNMYFVIILDSFFSWNNSQYMNNPYYYTLHLLWIIWLAKIFNQYAIACEFDMINATSALDIAFIMLSSKFP